MRSPRDPSASGIYYNIFFHNIPPWMGLIQSEPQQNVQWCRHPLGYTTSFKKLHSRWKNHLVDEKCLNLWMVGGFLRPAECFYFSPNGAFSQFMPLHKPNTFTQKFYPKTKFNHPFSIYTFYKGVCYIDALSFSRFAQHKQIRTVDICVCVCM